MAEAENQVQANLPVKQDTAGADKSAVGAAVETVIAQFGTVPKTTNVLLRGAEFEVIIQPRNNKDTTGNRAVSQYALNANTYATQMRQSNTCNAGALAKQTPTTNRQKKDRVTTTHSPPINELAVINVFAQSCRSDGALLCVASTRCAVGSARLCRELGENGPLLRRRLASRLLSGGDATRFALASSGDTFWSTDSIRRGLIKLNHEP